MGDQRFFEIRFRIGRNCLMRYEPALRWSAHGSEVIPFVLKRGPTSTLPLPRGYLSTPPRARAPRTSSSSAPGTQTNIPASASVTGSSSLLSLADTDRPAEGG